MMQPERQANELFRKKGALHLEIFQLNNTEVPKEDIVNISACVLHYLLQLTWWDDVSLVENKRLLGDRL
jgi:hypothetical protein